MDVKSRTIGIDKEFLDQQILEKQWKKEQEEDKLNNGEEHVFALIQPEFIPFHIYIILTGIHNTTVVIIELNNEKDMCRYLHERDSIASFLRNKETNETKETLLQQMQMPKNNAIGKGTPLNVDHCTVASIQKFTGEDLEYQDRRKIQQEQLKKWCDQSILDKQERVQLEQVSELNYAQQLLHDDALRVLKAQEEEHLQKHLKKCIQEENIKLQEQKLTQNTQMSPSDQDHQTIFCETSDDTSLCHFQQNKIRPDHFKGYSKEALSQIIHENDAVVMTKHQIRLMDERENEKWAQYEQDVLRAQEVNAILQQETRRREKIENAAFLEQQRLEQKMNRDFLKSSRFGHIESGFFESFGTSCR
jgi:hypothetical protein